MSNTNIATYPSLREVFDRAIRLYHAHFLALVGISATLAISQTVFSALAVIAQIPILTLNERLRSGTFVQDQQAIMAVSGQMLTFSVLNLVIQCLNLTFIIAGLPLAYAALAYAVWDGLSGRQAGFASAYRASFRLWPRYIRVVLLAFGLGLLLCIWSLVPCIGWLTGPGAIGVMQILGAFSPFILIIERQTTTGTLRRAWDLLRRQFWWVAKHFIVIIFGLLAITLPVLGISSVIARSLAPALLPDGAIAGSSALQLVQSAVTSIMSLPLTILTTPIFIILAAILYAELRARTEGADPLATPALTAGETAPPDNPAPMPAPETGNLITMPEVGNLVPLSVAFIVYYTLLFGLVFILQGSK
jgi:hypothetical protein